MPKSTTTGLYGRTFLELLYRYGALTREHFVRLTGLSVWAVDRQLRHLEKGGLVARAQDVAGWQQPNSGRPKTGYHLTLPAGAKAAAFFSGIENDILSLRHYRRVRLPGTVSHRLLANEYLISAVEAGAEAEETHAESCPAFPLFGTGTAKSDRSDSPYKFSRIVPDGVFVLNSQTYLLECETGTHARKELVGKLNDYGGRWRRMLRPNSGEKKYHDAGARPEPVIILTPSSEHKKMRDYLRARLPDAEDWRAGDEAIRAASGGKAEAGQLIIVAGISEVLRKDEETDEVTNEALSRVYRPLYRYPEEHSDPAPGGVKGWRVSLEDAAAVSRRIIVPQKKEVA